MHPRGQGEWLEQPGRNKKRYRNLQQSQTQNKRRMRKYEEVNPDNIQTIVSEGSTAKTTKNKRVCCLIVLIWPWLHSTKTNTKHTPTQEKGKHLLPPQHKGALLHATSPVRPVIFSEATQFATKLSAIVRTATIGCTWLNAGTLESTRAQLKQLQT